MKLYFAGALFTLAERRFNASLADHITAHSPAHSVFLPQACDGDLLGQPDFAQLIYTRMIAAIERCDVVVAMLDGVSIDSGTCVEIGYARALGKKVIGVRTDFRGNSGEALSPQTIGACDHVIWQSSSSTTVECLAKEIVTVLNICLK